MDRARKLMKTIDCVALKEPLTKSCDDDDAGTLVLYFVAFYQSELDSEIVQRFLPGLKNFKL